MRTPPHVIAYRVITVTIASAILLAVAFGLARQGPLGGLGPHIGFATTQSGGIAP